LPDVSPLDALETVVSEVVEPAAADVDRTGTFPRAAVDALADAGLLRLVATGGSIRDAATVVERLARADASVAMVTCMHYAGSAVIVAAGSEEAKAALAEGRHLTTLAFSESGSRSMFWAPTSTATAEGDEVVLEASKSWVTSAGEADTYVWSSRPLGGDGANSLWLVPASTPGLKVGAPFDGLGLRGNASSPIQATGARIPAANALGADGGGFDLMMGVVLPIFNAMNAAASVGLMETATARAADHVAGTRFEHLDQTLAEQPIVRNLIARMRVRTDMCRTLWLDTLDALGSGREDAMLRVLEVKAACGEAATEVTDLGMRACGGAAFRKEVGIERAFRDARAATVMAPTTDVLYDFIGKAVTGQPLF
jgi:alkylation response protein AidB-like acyl-CoA dehydrogenase